jgi:hypothetical protein
MSDVRKTAVETFAAGTTNNETAGVMRIKALERAVSYIGQMEVPKGSNWGKFVQDTLKTVGITFPAYWCQAFTYRCYNEAATELGVKNTCHRTGGVLLCWNNTPTELRLMKKDATEVTVLPGYQGIMNFGKGKGHTFIVERVEGRTIHTVEGNSDANGSRTGGMVCRNKRSLDDDRLVGFIKH